MSISVKITVLLSKSFENCDSYFAEQQLAFVGTSERYRPTSAGCRTSSSAEVLSNGLRL